MPPALVGPVSTRATAIFIINTDTRHKEQDTRHETRGQLLGEWTQIRDHETIRYKPKSSLDQARSLSLSLSLSVYLDVVFLATWLESLPSSDTLSFLIYYPLLVTGSFSFSSSSFNLLIDSLLFTCIHLYSQSFHLSRFFSFSLLSSHLPHTLLTDFCHR